MSSVFISWWTSGQPGNYFISFFLLRAPSCGESGRLSGGENAHLCHLRAALSDAEPKCTSVLVTNCLLLGFEVITFSQKLLLCYLRG